MPRDLRIVLPVSGIGRGKSRLASVLSPIERTRLNRHLLDHALSVVGEVSPAPGSCLVISPCARVRRIARLAGAVSVAQARPLRGLNAAIRQSVRAAMRQGARRVLVMPVDLPRASVSALAEVMRRARSGGQCIIVPDRAEAGTNVLLMPARLDVRAQFGENSFLRHLRSAQERGHPATVLALPPLMQDLDTPEDLAAWISAGRRWD